MAVFVGKRQLDRIVIPQKKKRYKLSELLAQCDPALPLSAEEQEWVDAPAVGPEYNAESR